MSSPRDELIAKLKRELASTRSEVGKLSDTDPRIQQRLAEKEAAGLSPPSRMASLRALPAYVSAKEERMQLEAAGLAPPPVARKGRGSPGKSREEVVATQPYGKFSSEASIYESQQERIGYNQSKTASVPGFLGETPPPGCRYSENQAATVVQANFRGRAARSQVKELRVQRRERQEENDAAVRVQSLYRGKKSRAEVEAKRLKRQKLEARADFKDSAPIGLEAVEDGEERIHALLDQLAKDKETLSETMKYLPDQMLAAFSSPDFAAACNAGFDQLDQNCNGVLSASETFPLVKEMSREHPMSVNEDHCKQLIQIFDKGNEGVLSREAFAEFCKFVNTMVWLESQTRTPSNPQTPDQEQAADARLHRLLDKIMKDKEAMGDVMEHLPAEFRDSLTSATFTQWCTDVFTELDKDGNGVLTVQELAPVIVQLSQEHPVSVTEQHCERLVYIFDTDCDGRISQDEFFNFSVFVMAVTWLEEQTSLGVARNDTTLMPSDISGRLAAGEERIHELLDRMMADKFELNDQSLNLPLSLRELLASTEFVDSCNAGFASYDTEGKGFLSSAEIYPLLAELSQEHPICITEEHCDRLIRVFDKDRNGVITRDEFADYCRFSVVAAWLDASSADGFGAEAAMGEMRVHDLLDQIAEDTLILEDVISYLPPEVAASLTSTAFAENCSRGFTNLDLDGNGVLTHDEVYPILIDLSQEHPISVTEDHCRRLVHIFDKKGRGCISREDFVSLCRFIQAICWLENQEVQEERQADGTGTETSSKEQDFTGAMTSYETKEFEVRDVMTGELLTATTVTEVEKQNASGAMMENREVKDAFTGEVLFAGIEEEYTCIDAATGEYLSSKTVATQGDQQNAVSNARSVGPDGTVSKLVARTVIDPVTGEATTTTSDLYEEDERIHQLLDQLRDDKAALGDVLPCLPLEMRDALSSTEFIASCNDGFSDLDLRGHGVLTANEVYPLVAQLSQEHPISVTQEHCERLVQIFDADGNGVISRDEFVDFCKFVTAVCWLEAEVARTTPEGDVAHVPADDPEVGTERIHDLLDRIMENKEMLGDVMALLPMAMRDALVSPEFVSACNSGFSRLDADKNGVLTVPELFPVLAELSQEHQHHVTEEHCKRFLHIFDKSGKGVITRDEFAEYCRFVEAVSWLEVNNPNLVSAADSLTESSTSPTRKHFDDDFALPTEVCIGGTWVSTAPRDYDEVGGELVTPIVFSGENVLDGNEFEFSEFDNPECDVAAAKVQSMYRGRQARSRTQELKERRRKEREEEEWAATKVQSLQRGKQARRKSKDLQKQRASYGTVIASPVLGTTEREILDQAFSNLDDDGVGVGLDISMAHLLKSADDKNKLPTWAPKALDFLKLIRPSSTIIQPTT